MSAIVIVGAGVAGARAAETLRARGHEGPVVLIGAEDVPPYQRPALSKEFLLGETGREDLALRPRSFWSDQQVELVLGARVVDLHGGIATTGCGRTFRYDDVVIATGARPRRLALPTPNGVHVLRTLRDAERLRAALESRPRLAILGGGFVGAEVASTARALGVDIVMVEAAPTPFAGILGVDVATTLAHRYRAHGVDLRTSVRVDRFETESDGTLSGAQLTDGSRIRCTAALVSVGVEPERTLADSAPGKFHLCGDAAGGGHWTRAAYDGAAAAHAVLGLDPPAPPTPFFWSDQFGLRLQLVGTTAGAAIVDVDGAETDFVARYRATDGRTLGALAVNRPAEVGALRRELALTA